MKIYYNLMEAIGAMITMVSVAIILWLYFLVYGPRSGGSLLMLVLAVIAILGMAISVIGNRRARKT